MYDIFFQIEPQISQKCVVTSTFPFWITRTLAKIHFPPVVTVQAAQKYPCISADATQSKLEPATEERLPSNKRRLLAFSWRYMQICLSEFRHLKRESIIVLILTFVFPKL